jgi:hypothetical protein
VISQDRLVLTLFGLMRGTRDKLWGVTVARWTARLWTVGDSPPRRLLPALDALAKAAGFLPWPPKRTP